MTVTVGREQVLSFRLRANHLDERLPTGSFAHAARYGLQDTAPRSAVASLHARVEACRPDSWEDESLVQIWGPRFAAYVVARCDLGIFTRGCLPRDPARVRAIDDLADRVCGLLNGGREHSRHIYAAIGADNPLGVRMVALSGRVVMRWDTSTVVLWEVDPPQIDPEDARIELARRCVRHLAPLTRDRLQWWTGMDADDAALSWDAIAGELVEVTMHRESRFVHRDDMDDLVHPRPASGVRLLPMEEIYGRFDRADLITDERDRARVYPQKSLGYTPGALLIDGEIAGSWARQQGRFTVYPFRTFDDTRRDAIEAEIESFPVAVRRRSVTWTAP